LVLEKECMIVSLKNYKRDHILFLYSQHFVIQKRRYVTLMTLQGIY